MSDSAYNLACLVILVAVCCCLAVSVACLSARTFKWGGVRKKWFVGASLAFLMVALLIAAQSYLLYCVWLPEFGRRQLALIEQSRSDESVLHRGDSAPSFETVDTEGNRFDLESQRGKLVLVNFFATWCGPCMVELPEIQQIWDQHQSNHHFTLIVIGREETDETVRNFKAKSGYTFPMAADADRNIYSSFAKKLIPRTYLIGPDGNISGEFAGAGPVEIQKLKAEVQNQLAKMPQ